MRKNVKISVLLAAALIVVFAAAEGAFAESKVYNGSAYFDGKSIKSTFKTSTVADAVTNLQPGDDVSFRVKYTNKYNESTDWYMANEVIQTLEKADAAKKVPKGTGTPENGGYTYELIHKDKNGVKTILFSNSEVGGDAKPAKMEGLEQATNALDDWFYIQTLKKGESGQLTLNVAFEGETEVNDYMDTDGGLMLRFAVELTGSDGSSAPPENDKPKYQQRIKTGDMTMLWMYIAMLLAGLVMLVIVLKKMKKEQGGEVK